MRAGASGKAGSSRAALLAGAACGALILLNLHLLNREIALSPITDAEIAPDAPIPAAVDMLARPAATDPSAYPATLARPLFRASRRPPDAVEAEAPRPAAPSQRRAARLPDGLQLVGIVKENGKAGRALIRSGEQPTGEWIEVGHVLEGWRLSQIEQRSILFETEGETQSLSLYPEGGAGEQPEQDGED